MSQSNCLHGFPHILKNIKDLWGHPELEIYINKILLQDEPREGFPTDAFRELNDILDVHRLLYAKCDKSDHRTTKRLDHGSRRW